MIIRKTAAELEKMRSSGLLVYEILKKLGDMVSEGVSTYDLEAAAEKMIADAGARPAFILASTAAPSAFPLRT